MNSETKILSTGYINDKVTYRVFVMECERVGVTVEHGNGDGKISSEHQLDEPKTRFSDDVLHKDDVAEVLRLRAIGLAEVERAIQRELASSLAAAPVLERTM